MFIIACFSEKSSSGDDLDTVEVVPSIWYDKGLCSYPPYTNTALVKKAVKKIEIPTPFWPKYVAKIIGNQTFGELFILIALLFS